MGNISGQRISTDYPAKNDIGQSLVKERALTCKLFNSDTTELVYSKLLHACCMQG